MENHSEKILHFKVESAALFWALERQHGRATTMEMVWSVEYPTVVGEDLRQRMLEISGWAAGANSGRGFLRRLYLMKHIEKKRKMLDLLKKIKHSDSTGPQLEPEQPRHDDIYLVAFPKSGITWLSTIVAQLFLSYSGSSRIITPYNLQKYIPDIHVSRCIPITAMLPMLEQRMIKSHSLYNENYKQVFYLSRDPRDALVSYWHFMTSLGLYSESISRFVRSRSFGARAWNNHIIDWYTRVPPSTTINFIQYEELKNDACSVLNRFVTLSGFSVDHEVINRAIDLHDIALMRKAEMYYREKNPTVSDVHQFIRKGQSGGYNDDLRYDDIKYIEDVASEGMKIIGYL